MSDVPPGDSFADVLVRARDQWSQEGEESPPPEIVAALSADLLRTLGDLEEREQFNAERRECRKQMRTLIEHAAERVLADTEVAGDAT